jgi:arabinogalactan oligomer/maltooligosaccharide transport system permease protein
MKRALLIAGGTVGGLGAVLAITPPQLSSTTSTGSLSGSLGGGTYLMYGFFNTIPKELDEAAKIDGATHTQIYYRIILRLVAPVLAVMALLSFIGTFGDYVLASIVFNTNDQYTVAVGLQSLLADPWTKQWAMFAAGAVMSSLPIVIIFVSLQKYITNGLTGGAVKG